MWATAIVFILIIAAFAVGVLVGMKHKDRINAKKSQIETAVSSVKDSFDK